MLSSIHPFGERARGQRYAVTTAWFALGATVGGLLLGTVMAALAAGVAAVGVGGLIPALVVIIASAVWDLSRRPVPSYARQVDENWLPRYRGWVYGMGFGVQLGVGFSTYVKTALTYGFVLAAILLGSPIVAVWSGLVFGAARGLSVMTTSRVQSPHELREFFARLIASQKMVRTTGALTVIVIAGLAVLEVI